MQEHFQSNTIGIDLFSRYKHRFFVTSAINLNIINPMQKAFGREKPAKNYPPLQMFLYQKTFAPPIATPTNIEAGLFFTTF